MNKKIYHKIGNAYDAYWFIHNHPKLQRMVRTEATPKEARKMEKAGFVILRDRGGKCWHLRRHLMIPAIEENLSVFYTKTNRPGGHGHVDKDKSKNKFVECWLEFGPVEYGYMSNRPDPKTNWDMESFEQNFHDYKLDCGGSSYDVALIQLAKNVRREYGDYSLKTPTDPCGPRPCADCKDIGHVMKRLKLAHAKEKR